jgi:acetolactate synthase-1/2/3 large subunit
MAVILHNLVGLLHACMAIYYAYLDRVPIFIRRHRPDGRSQAAAAHRLDPHRAGAGQRGARLRRWDYQPTSIDGVPESFARAYS